MTENARDLPSDALSRVRAAYPSLSPTEQRVADFVLADHGNVIRMTLADLASRTGVSEATIMRYCRSVGYAGFVDFKMALLLAFKGSPRFVYENVEVGDTPQVIANKVFGGAIQALEDTLAVLDIEQFEHALALLGQAQRILVVGVGTSSPMANELFNRLFRLRLDCQVQTDSYLQVMQAALLTSRDALVAISQAGQSDPPITTASVARKNRCPVISITGDATSALGRLSDVILLSVSKEARLEKTTSRIAQHAIIQALYAALAMRSVEDANEAEQTIWQALIRSSSASETGSFDPGR